MEAPVVSYILPCLDEADPLPDLIHSLYIEAVRSLIPFEVIIADNGSTDGSIKIAEELTSRFDMLTVVHCPTPGYGATCRFGASHARGRHVIFLDADGTYASEDAIMCAKECLEYENSVVIGNRLHAGVSRDVMPWTHRYIGTPFFSLLIRSLFRVNIPDVNCGLRGFKKNTFDSLGCTATGMEFASESIALAARKQIPFLIFPITYKKRIGASKLRTIRDGFRHLFTIFRVRFSSPSKQLP